VRWSTGPGHDEDAQSAAAARTAPRGNSRLVLSGCSSALTGLVKGTSAKPLRSSAAGRSRSSRRHPVKAASSAAIAAVD
jgi:hypothetical protein